MTTGRINQIAIHFSLSSPRERRKKRNLRRRRGAPSAQLRMSRRAGWDPLPCLAWCDFAFVFYFIKRGPIPQGF